MEVATTQPTLLRTAIPAGPETALVARRCLAGLRDRLDPDLFQRLRLLVSELVTNSVRHAGVEPGSHVILDVDADDDSVRVSVIDGGRGFMPRPRSRDIDEPGGWGLVLLDQLADRWGVEHDGSTRVWLELDRGSESD